MKNILRSFVWMVALLTAFTAVSASASQALAASKNCMACHGVEKKVVGPAFKDVARMYAGRMDAQSLVATKIIKGSTGVWGPVPMLPNPQVSEADAKKLADWVLSLK